MGNFSNINGCQSTAIVENPTKPVLAAVETISAVFVPLEATCSAEDPLQTLDDVHNGGADKNCVIGALERAMELQTLLHPRNTSKVHLANKHRGPQRSCCSISKPPAQGVFPGSVRTGVGYCICQQALSWKPYPDLAQDDAEEQSFRASLSTCN